MVALVVTIESEPEAIDPVKVARLADWMRAQPGFVRAYHMREAAGSRRLAIVVLESVADARAFGAAMDARPAADRLGVSPASIDLYEVDHKVA